MENMKDKEMIVKKKKNLKTFSCYFSVVSSRRSKLWVGFLTKHPGFYLHFLKLLNMGLVSRIGRGQHWSQFRSFSSVSSDSALQLELFIGRWHSQHRAWRTALQARRDAHSSSGVASDLSEVWPVPGGAAQLWPIAHLAGQHRSVTSLSCLSHFRIPHLQFSSHKASISVPILSFFFRGRAETFSGVQKYN